VRTLISAAHVLSHEDGHHALLSHGQVVFEDSRIVFVGRGFDGVVDEALDLGESLVMPGLIDLNALADIDHLILDSWATPARAGGLEWSEEWFRGRRSATFSADERLAIREYAIVQLALHGITTFMPIAAETHGDWAEPADELIGMADIARRIGLRAFLGPSFRSGVTVTRADLAPDVLFDEQLGWKGLAEATRFLDYCEELDDPLITGVLLPCRIESLTPDLMRATAELSEQRDVFVRLHALQSLCERELIEHRHAMSPLDLLETTGHLTSRFLLPHGTYTDRSSKVFGEDRGDLARLADAGVSIVHCPLTAFRGGMVLESLDAYLDAGVNICLGSDSFPPDLIRGMDVGWHMAQLVEGRADAGAPERWVDAATLGASRALRRPDLGRLEVGAQADLVAFALDDIRDGVVEDPIRTLLMNGTARQATHTVVAGRVIVRDGIVPGVDVRRLRARGQELFDKLRRGYSARDHAHRSTAELFPPTFPAARLASHESDPLRT
jgi:8-oxoguanine deaminase